MIKRVLKWILNIFIIFFAVIFILLIMSTIHAKKNPNEIPGIAEYKFLTVLSGSMEPVFSPGDVIAVKNTDITDVEVGDIITFRKPDDKKTLVTHRVSKIVKKPEGIHFHTKGDANNAEDIELVSQHDVIGVYEFYIPKVGYLGNFIRTKNGFIVCIILPSIFLVLNEIKVLFKYVDKEKEKKELL